MKDEIIKAFNLCREAKEKMEKAAPAYLQARAECERTRAAYNLLLLKWNPETDTEIKEADAV